MIQAKPIRSAQYVVNQLLEGVKLADLQDRIEITGRPLDWSLFVLGAVMVADRLASPAVRAELDAFERFISDEMDKRCEVAYASLASEDCEVIA